MKVITKTCSHDHSTSPQPIQVVPELFQCTNIRLTHLLSFASLFCDFDSKKLLSFASLFWDFYSKKLGILYLLFKALQSCCHAERNGRIFRVKIWQLYWSIFWSETNLKHECISQYHLWWGVRVWKFQNTNTQIHKQIQIQLQIQTKEPILFFRIWRGVMWFDELKIFSRNTNLAKTLSLIKFV